MVAGLRMKHASRLSCWRALDKRDGLRYSHGMTDTRTPRSKSTASQTSTGPVVKDAAHYQRTRRAAATVGRPSHAERLLRNGNTDEVNHRARAIATDKPVANASPEGSVSSVDAPPQ